MPRWTQDDYNAYLRKLSHAQSEPPVRNEPVAEEARESKDASRVSVRIVSFRRRSVDPDNLCPKYFIDCLRYAGLIQDDREQDITLEIRQEKVGCKEDEGTLIELVYGI